MYEAKDKSGGGDDRNLRRQTLCDGYMVYSLVAPSLMMTMTVTPCQVLEYYCNVDTLSTTLSDTHIYCLYRPFHHACGYIYLQWRRLHCVYYVDVTHCCICIKYFDGYTCTSYVACRQSYFIYYKYVPGSSHLLHCSLNHIYYADGYTIR